MTQRLAGIYHWMMTTLAAHQYSLIALQTVIDGDPHVASYITSTDVITAGACEPCS